MSARDLVLLVATLIGLVGIIRLGIAAMAWRHSRQVGYPADPCAIHHAGMGSIMLLVALVCLLMSGPAVSASSLTSRAPGSAARQVHIPDASALYRHWVRQAATDQWGIDAPVALLAAQIHQESAWDPHARSGVGAEGLAQFMPSTGRWLARLFPSLGPYDPWDPRWSARAAAQYDAWLVDRNAGANPCATWAFALSAYNGGELRLHREQALAEKAGRNPDTWFGSVARYRARAASAWVQNRTYVRRILTVLEPAYIAAGWSGQAVCHV